MLEKGKMNKLIIKESQGTEIHEILFYVSYFYRIDRIRKWYDIIVKLF